MYIDEKMEVYEIQYQNPPSIVKLKCVQEKPGLWKVTQN
jgi:hypothetical protein